MAKHSITYTCTYVRAYMSCISTKSPLGAVMYCNTNHQQRVSRAYVRTYTRTYVRIVTASTRN